MTIFHNQIRTLLEENSMNRQTFVQLVQELSFQHRLVDLFKNLGSMMKGKFSHLDFDFGCFMEDIG